MADAQPSRLSPHLRRLEAEGIAIIRETAASFRNPVLLYSIGKDSSVVLHMAMKAFAPGKPPFPLLHIATGWDFKAMLEFRDRRVAELGLHCIVHTNPDGLARGIGPLTHGSQLHMNVMGTEALKQALDAHGFDAALGGARRDEEKARAKERVFSHRTAGHAWEPRNQRPELWGLYNTRLNAGEGMRVFPLSNWTEFDVWDYIAAEEIPVVPLYFAALRPMVRRSGALIMRDDDRMPLEHGESVEPMWVRFRTMGDWPLTGAHESRAETIGQVLAEIRESRKSEREGRLIDSDQEASMERKKREGYF
ncbi:sulfate adenylyltransferase subunit CysD [Falsiroseomonas stagni]|uniref:Sulfate adenylyltransferase subunit 2 n=1 Tax=Falsiroseomonas stagni DSM 19981 TaxID=1123062 RepID=A0A1I3Y6I0_9PROT|nr:sulfate adenylyltransferase subunit CysD [Falsiroseomonas stagni]SFK26826.1 sulfate adenylyltransferase subunit 2 [Falsiroseomonas stagni DSM 19981]